jgi:hypothetical protein
VGLEQPAVRHRAGGPLVSQEPPPPRARAHAYGDARLTPTSSVVAGTFGTWRLIYRAGLRGVAPGGRLGIAWRWPADWGHPQFTNPAEPHYTSLATTGRCQLAATFGRELALHPWDHLTAVTLTAGALQPGEEISVTFGDRTGGGPGLRAQTFRETTCTFRVFVDADASGRWTPLATAPSLHVSGGPGVRLVLIAPTDVIAGTPFAVTVRVEDVWNNPSPSYRGRVRVSLSNGAGVAEQQFTATHDGVARLRLALPEPGVYRLVVRDDDGRTAESNPVRCQHTRPRYVCFWGDSHSGQSQAGCGAGSVAEHFHYLRDVAAVDFGTHQGNCFMLTAADWAETCRVARVMNEDGRFVAFPGYEWSGETAVGGDHNILFLDDDQPLYRCSHQLVADTSDAATDLPHITDVYRHYAGRRVILVPHVGGRRSDLAFHAPELEPVVEIHSAHATSEWFFLEALARGYRVGVTGGSDEIMGRPGASYPGFALGRNTRGGLTGVYATALTREAIFEALKARRTYATTGDRIALWVEADGHPLGSEYVATAPPHIRCEVWGTAGIERLELFRGPERIYAASLGDQRFLRERTLRIAWTGAAARGTGAEGKLVWDGRLDLRQGRLVRVQPYGFDGASDAILETGDRHVRWRSVTALDSDGLIVEYAATEETVFTFTSPVTSFTFRPADVAERALVIDVGPVDQRVTVSRLPRDPRPREASFEFTDERMPAGTSAYFVRVIQDDDEKAWSSPIFISTMTQPVDAS